MSDTKTVLTPEQIAEMRARAVETRQLGMEVMLLRVGKVEALHDAAERCARVDTYLDDMQDSLTTAIARAEAAEKERDEIVSAIIGHDDEDMKHDLKSVAQLVKDVLVERDDLARRLGEAEHSAANFARWFTQAAQHLHIVQPIYLGRAQCDGAVRDAKAYLATLTTPPADGSGEGA